VEFPACDECNNRYSRITFSKARKRYPSQAVRENLATFEAWTKSEAFRAAHSRAGNNKPLYLDHPQFEGVKVRRTVGRGKTVAA